MGHIRQDIQEAIQGAVGLAWTGAAPKVNHPFSADDTDLAAPWVNCEFGPEDSTLLCKTPRYVRHNLTLVIHVYADSATRIPGQGETNLDAVLNKAQSLISRQMFLDNTLNGLVQKTTQETGYELEKEKEAERVIGKISVEYDIEYLLTESIDEVAV